MDKLEKENLRIYERMRDELIQSQRMNSDNFDKAILSLSSAGLGITVSFITNLIDLSKAHYLFALYLTWAFFIVAIVSTIISFLVSQSGISKQLDSLEKIYIKKEEVDNKKVMRIAKALKWLTVTSAIAFILAILFLVSFSITNISRGATKMSDDNKSKTTNLSDGAPLNNLQKVVGKTPLQKGLPINNLQPVVKPTSSTTSGSSNNSNKKK